MIKIQHHIEHGMVQLLLLLRLLDANSAPVFLFWECLPAMHSTFSAQAIQPLDKNGTYTGERTRFLYLMCHSHTRQITTERPQQIQRWIKIASAWIRASNVANRSDGVPVSVLVLFLFKTQWNNNMWIYLNGSDGVRDWENPSTFFLITRAIFQLTLSSWFKQEKKT